MTFTTGITCKCGAIPAAVITTVTHGIILERLDLSDSSQLREIRGRDVYYLCKCGRKKHYRRQQ